MQEGDQEGGRRSCRRLRQPRWLTSVNKGYARVDLAGGDHWPTAKQDPHPLVSATLDTFCTRGGREGHVTMRT